MHKIVDSKWIDGNITDVADDEVFVFGSNAAGIHGAGAAKQALQWGAVFGKGLGFYGATYAIPTKNRQLKTLETFNILQYVQHFKLDAELNDHIKFLVTRIGCGLAGYTDGDIAPMFEWALTQPNVYLPIEWREILTGEQ